MNFLNWCVCVAMLNLSLEPNWQICIVINVLN